MGEAARRRAAAHACGPWPGGPGRCPRCLSTRVACEAAPAIDGMEFYGRTLAVCLCGAIWEPIDEASIWDRTDPFCSTYEPCDNCAFRPGSPEQLDTEKWKDMIAKLRAGTTFHCHKGVPLAPNSEDGFAYPVEKSQLRLCRGFLNAWGKWRAAELAAETRENE